MSIDLRMAEAYFKFKRIPKQAQVEDKLDDIKIETAEAELELTKKFTKLIKQLELDTMSYQQNYDFIVKFEKTDDYTALDPEMKERFSNRKAECIAHLSGVDMS